MAKSERRNLGMTQNSEHFRIFQSHMRHKRSEHTIKNMLKNTDCNVQARRKQHVMAKNGPIVYFEDLRGPRDNDENAGYMIVVMWILASGKRTYY